MTPLEMIVVADNTVPLVEVLGRLGIEYWQIPGTMRCPIHKGGTETKPSARIYEDNRIYCHTCNTQYGPVDVWASRKGVSKSDAAKALLEQWVPSEEKIKEALEGFSVTQKVDGSFTFFRDAERALLEYRHRVALPKWRVWTRKLDDLREALAGDPDGMLRVVTSFKHLLRKDLGG